MSQSFGSAASQSSPSSKSQHHGLNAGVTESIRRLCDELQASVTRSEEKAEDYVRHYEELGEMLNKAERCLNAKIIVIFFTLLTAMGCLAVNVHFQQKIIRSLQQQLMEIPRECEKCRLNDKTDAINKNDVEK